MRRSHTTRSNARPIEYFESFLTLHMKLIGSLTSPFVRKVRIVMAEKKLDYQLVIDEVWSESSTISQSNPLGQVPCLIMEGGEALFDSRVIVEYLDTLSPVGKLIPSTGRERAEVKTWEALADGLIDASILARQEKRWPMRKESERSSAWIDRQMGKVHNSLKAMEKGLGDKVYCSGIHFSLADIALGCALGYLDLRFEELDWRESHPELARLYEKLSTRTSFVETR